MDSGVRFDGFKGCSAVLNDTMFVDFDLAILAVKVLADG